MASAGLFRPAKADEPHVARGGWARVEAALDAPVVWRTAVVLLMALQAILVVTHHAWLDEWQALQIAVQSPTLGDLLQNLRYEGHPPLWYLILRAIGTVIPYLWVLAVAQLGIAGATQALILFRAPLGRLERLLIGSSYFILFEFGTLSRSLGLGALLTVAFFAARSPRAAWGAVILLPMVDFQFGLVSLCLIALLLKDGRWSWAGAALWAGSSLLAAISILPAADMQPAFAVPSLVYGLVRLLVHLSALLIPFHTQDGQINWFDGLPLGLGVVMGPAFLLFSLHQLWTVPLHRWIYAAFLAATMALSLFVYPLGIRHLTVIALLLILLKWREAAAGGELDVAFKAWLLSISIGGMIVVGIVQVRSFDVSPAAAEFIKSRNLEDEHWVSYPNSVGQSVSALLDREMHTLKKGCTQSFMRWDFRDGIKSKRDLTEALGKVAGDYGRFYLVSDADLGSEDGLPIQRLARFGPGYNGYAYNLYVVAPRLPPKRQPPPCSPARLPLAGAKSG